MTLVTPLTTESTSVRRSTNLFVMVGIFWSFCGVLLKSITWGPMPTVTVRSYFGVIAQYIPLVRNTRRRYGISWRAAAYRAVLNIFRFDAFHWLGAAASCANMIFLVWAFERSSATNAGFFQGSGVVLIGIFSGPFLNEWATREDWKSISIALVGMFFLGFAGKDASGTVLGVLCSITLAFSQLCYKRRSQESDSGEGALEMSILSDVMVGVIGIPFIYWAGLPSARDCWLILALSTFAWTLPSTVYMLCVKDLPIFRSLFLTLLDPVLTPVWPWLCLGETPTGWEMCGGAIVCFAVLHFAHQQAQAARLKASLTLLEPREV
jgi:drug/metabolite transporter (DMT)-like permease